MLPFQTSPVRDFWCDLFGEPPRKYGLVHEFPTSPRNSTSRYRGKLCTTEREAEEIGSAGADDVSGHDAIIVGNPLEKSPDDST